FVLGNASEHGRIRDLVPIQMQDRDYGSVTRRVDELRRVPARRERPGLRLSVADDAEHHKVRIIEGGTVGVRQRVAELAALVDGAGGFGRDVARAASGKRELPKQPSHSS